MTPFNKSDRLVLERLTRGVPLKLNEGRRLLMKDLVAKKEDISPIPPEVKLWFPIPEAGEVNVNARIKPERIMIPATVVNGLQKYILNCLKEISGYSKPELDGVIVGLSGGIDSTTIAAIAKTALEGTRYFVKGIILGRGQFGEQGEMNELEYQDVLFARRAAEDMGLNYEYLDISLLADAVYKIFSNSQPWNLSGILPRIRSALLLQVADDANAICAGSTNGTEFLLGAFSVGGPGGHFAPLIDFYKSEVYKIGEMLGIPRYVLDRRPAVSELGFYDDQLYGASCFIIDPILRRMGWQKRSPENVARELGHSPNWLHRIKKLRIEGEKGRKFPPVLIVCRGYKARIKPDLKWNRDRYFNNLF